VRRWTLIAALAAGLTCGCKSEPRAGTGGAPAEPPVQTSTPAAAPGWVRARPTESDAVARALYRRALDAAADGRSVEAAALLEALRRDHPQSRHARRVADRAAHPAGIVALASALASTVLPGLLEGRTTRP
jgi:hypothetical protein